MKNLYILFFAIIPNLLFAQTTVTINYDKIYDAELYMTNRSGYSHMANTNFGSSSRFIANAWTESGSTTFRRSLIKFDLSAIEPGTLIDNATLYLYSDPNVTSLSAWNGNSKLSGSNAIILEQVIDSWEESTVTWNSYHQIGIQPNFLDQYLSCDEDWSWFRVNVGTNLTLETFQVDGKNPMDTEIEVFEITAANQLGATIATDDNSGTDNFSMISRFFAPGRYAVRIVNSTGDFGFYNFVIQDQCNSFINDPISISSLSLLCSSSSTISISGAPVNDPATSITWNASPSNLFQVSSGSGASASIAAASGVSGTGSITFTLNHSTCGARNVTSNSFSVGVPHVDQINVNGDYCVDPLNTGFYTASYSGTTSILEWNWDVQDPWTLSYAYGNNAEIQAGDYSSVVLLRARNACGWTSGSLSGNPHIHYLNICGDYGIYSYPNPVDDHLTISLAEDVQVNVEGIGANGLTTDKNPRSNLIENIVIYDDSGNEIISQIVSDVSVNIDCSSLQKGTYIIHIKTNNGKIIRRFIK